MYIITITMVHADHIEKVRVQMDDNKSAKAFMWWCRSKGHNVRMKKGETVNLTQKEIALGVKLVNEFSKEKP